MRLNCGMKRTYLNFFLLLLYVLALFPPIIAQQPKTETEIRKLIANSHSNDLKTSDTAKQGLSKLDAKSLLALVSILKKGNPCVIRSRWPDT